ncbi:MAG: asparagine synthase-related protein, partial [Mangrovibacterium sp.]
MRELLVRATCNRIEPVKTGLHVSGGIDSCGIASVVADHSTDKGLLTGYSWTPETFSDPVEGVNEKEFIDAFHDDKTIPVKYIKPEENETVKNAILPEFPVQHIEHPVMKMAGEEGIEILFSGWGGDEFVSLSTRGTVNHLFFTFKWITLFQYARKRGLKHTIHQLRSD